MVTRGKDMSIASIMVYVDFDEGSEDRIRAAADLAGRFRSLLIGVGAWPLRKSELAPARETGSPSADEDRQQAIAQRLEQLGGKFRQAAGKSPHDAEWRSSPHFPREVVIEQARAADVLVIGREFREI